MIKTQDIKNILKRTIRSTDGDKSCPLKILPEKSKPSSPQAIPKRQKHQS